MLELNRTSGQETKRLCISWRTNEYDDEQTLSHFRRIYSNLKWKDIVKKLNDAVPEDRYRTIDAITSKWQAMKLAEQRSWINPIDESIEAQAWGNHERTIYQVRFCVSPVVGSSIIDNCCPDQVARIGTSAQWSLVSSGSFFDWLAGNLGWDGLWRGKSELLRGIFFAGSNGKARNGGCVWSSLLVKAKQHWELS